MLPALNLIIFGNFFRRGFGAKAIFQPAGGFHCLLRFQAPSPAKSVSMYPFNVVGGCGRTIECKLTPVANVSSILLVLVLVLVLKKHLQPGSIYIQLFSHCTATHNKADS